MTYSIAIPSYKRAKICNEKTLNFLHKNGINKELINVFVIEEEYDEYLNILDKDKYNEIVIGVKGIVEQVEFIEDYYGIGENIIRVDDDVIEIDLSLTNYISLHNFFECAFQECVLSGSYIWGIYPVFNPFFRKERDMMTKTLKFIIGCLYGFINRREKDLKLNITKICGNKDDVERSILYWLKDGIMIRFDRVAVKSKVYGTDGGGLGKMNDRLESMKIMTIMLNEKYPELTKIKVRKNGLYEIVFKAVKSPIKPVSQEIELPYHLEELDPSRDDIQELHALLAQTKITLCSGKLGRAKSFGTHRAMTLGICRARTTHKLGLSYMSKKYPELYKRIVEFGKTFVPFEFTTIHINHNVVCPRHLDPNNIGQSCIVALGDYTGCDLVIENVGTYDIKCKPLVFNGAKAYHYNTPLIDGDKYSLVFFNGN